jgi:eukaryotic-like serine/threonine-protein kinase
VADPAHGPAALNDPQVMAGLLRDLMPNAPREASILTLAVQHGSAALLAEHVAQGVEPETAVRLAASTFAASTAFTFDACEWAVRELAVASGLVDPVVADQQNVLPPEPLAPGSVPSARPPAAEHTDEVGQPAAGTAPSQYGPPASQHGSPPNQYAPPPASQFAPPASAYNQPVSPQTPMASPQGLPVSPYNQPASGYAQPAGSFGPPAGTYSSPSLYQTPPVATRPLSGRRKGRGGCGLLAVFVAVLLTVGAGAGWYFVFGPGATPKASGPSHHGNTSSPKVHANAAPDNVWVAQLGSVHQYQGVAALHSELAKIRAIVPGAKVLNSTRYASLRPHIWMIYLQDGFTNGLQALNFCAARGLTTKNECLGRYLSHRAADYFDQCYPPADNPSGKCYRH